MILHIRHSGEQPASFFELKSIEIDKYNKSEFNLTCKIKISAHEFVYLKIKTWGLQKKNGKLVYFKTIITNLCVIAKMETRGATWSIFFYSENKIK